MDSLFSPNASSVASPMPQSQNASLVGAEDMRTADQQKNVSGDGGRASELDKDAPAKRTRQNLCLKDKPLEVWVVIREHKMGGRK